MAGSSGATSRRPAPPAADCEFKSPRARSIRNKDVLTRASSFAFVEYEDRRDAEDAYHEMHNKRLTRDDLLKIEVRLGRYTRLFVFLISH